MSSERAAQAKAKRELAAGMFRQGMSVMQAREAVREKFEQGIANTDLYRVYHETMGTQPRRGRGGRKKKRRKVAKPKPKPKPAATSLVPIEIPPQLIPVQPRSPTVDALLRSLVQAMRAEGVDSLTIRADGGGRMYHVIERDINVTGG